MKSFLVIIILQILQITKGISQMQVESKPPEIWVSEYHQQSKAYSSLAPEEFRNQTEFGNKLISRQGTDYILNEISSVIFTCQAKYPVRWSIPDMKQLEDSSWDTVSTIPFRISNLYPREDLPINNYFKELLQIQPKYSNFFSVTFTCQSAKSKVFSTIHVYNNGRDVLENQNKTVTIYIPENDTDSDVSNPIILPCRPSNPNATVILEKKLVESWARISSKRFSFNPKIGFSPSRGKTAWKLTGLYKCTVNETGSESQASVLIDVTTLQQNADISETHQKENNSSVILTERNLTCCSDLDDDVLELHQDSCEDHLQCDVLKSKMHYSKKDKLNNANATRHCENIDLRGSSVSVQCRGKGVDYDGSFISHFKDNSASQSPGQISNLGESSIYDNELTTYVELENVERLKSSEKILILIGHHHSENSQNSGIVFSSANKPKSIVRGCPKEKDDQEIFEYKRKYFYEGESLMIMCLGLKYFYSDGAHLRINWVNGSKTTLKGEPNGCLKHVHLKDDKRIGIDSRNYDTGLISLFGKEVNASIEMESVDCFMPKWENDWWDKLTYNLNVRVSTAPEFKGGQAEETLHFFVNEKNREIIWEVLEGEPEPEVIVTKSKIKFDLIIVEGTFVKILLEKVGYENEGNYECTARNLRGSVTKRIKVVVKEEQKCDCKGEYSNVLLVCLLLVTVLSAFLLKSMVNYKLLQRKMKNQSSPELVLSRNETDIHDALAALAQNDRKCLAETRIQ